MPWATTAPTSGPSVRSWPGCARQPPADRTPGQFRTRPDGFPVETARMSRPLRLFVEETPRKVFVSALDWPGLARGARSEDMAVEALLAALPRYAKVAHKAGE